MVSLDFELHWGVRDHLSASGPYGASLRGARDAVPLMLDVFRRREVAATWAAVGLLFAKNRDELFDHAPRLRPSYRRRELDPYVEPIGRDEHDDPLHYAPSLIARIADTPRQEVGSHTFSHYYCLEPGQTVDQFAADLRAARAIAGARGIDVRSLVLPRNQINLAYLEVVREAGFETYRGNPRHWAFRASSREGLPRRAVRLLDAYSGVTGHHTIRWQRLERTAGVIDVPASLFLRPKSGGVSGELVVKRLVRALEHAAARGELVHLWWHPHNFGRDPATSVAMLDRVLAAYRRLADSHGMRSLTMGEVAGEL